jgi:dienelactone hydrolase
MVRPAALNPQIGIPATRGPLDRLGTMRSLTALIVAAALCGPAAAAAPAPVEIAANGVKLKGFIYRPEGNGPFPAIVGLHNCEGLAGSGTPLSARYSDWGERLMARGFVVLFPDSFGSRGMGAQCSAGQRSMRSGRERVGDADAARHWLQEQKYVAPDRVSLIGWANGAVAALWTVRPRVANKKDAKPDFRSAVAFSPGCRRLRDTAWSARLPTLVLIGAKDDWTPASACEQMVAGARGRSARASIVVYPGAHHDFDHPDLPLQRRSNVAFAAGGTGRVHVGTNATARADALKRVAEWIAR